MLPKKDLRFLPICLQSLASLYALQELKGCIYKPKCLYQDLMEVSVNSQFFGSSAFPPFVSIHPIQIIQDAQSAVFIVNEIVYLLQRRVSFRQIKDQILRELTNNEIIKGVRLSCSGRVGLKRRKNQKHNLYNGEKLHCMFSPKNFLLQKGVPTPPLEKSE